MINITFSCQRTHVNSTYVDSPSMISCSFLSMLGSTISKIWCSIYGSTIILVIHLAFLGLDVFPNRHVTISTLISMTGDYFLFCFLIAFLSHGVDEVLFELLIAKILVATSCVIMGTLDVGVCGSASSIRETRGFYSPNWSINWVSSSLELICMVILFFFGDVLAPTSQTDFSF